jgi:hypothetical protein
MAEARNNNSRIIPVIVVIIRPYLMFVTNLGIIPAKTTIWLEGMAKHTTSLFR